ncbi:hypothetical protein AVEN_230900-1 [Araneus ventricosus]|uniref:Uncharacterized protein n=1 Tax=Araneus ventricosus TaxID=182803 RepID=A0A4Y2A2N3_ARAVE|nr:hypothetical protein AVEN_230900-1 [Araneus ventricosus]
MACLLVWDKGIDNESTHRSTKASGESEPSHIIIWVLCKVAPTDPSQRKHQSLTPCASQRRYVPSSAAGPCTSSINITLPPGETRTCILSWVARGGAQKRETGVDCN